MKGLSAIHQRNALRSWRALDPDVEIIVFGLSEGGEEICAEVGAICEPNIQAEGRLPILSDMFSKAQKMASHNLVCYVNADIILPNNWLGWVQHMHGIKEYLAVGYRTDVLVDQELDYSIDRDVLKLKGILHSAAGIDYFAFPKAIHWDMPNFVVGRPGWDNWLLWKARRSNIPLVDISSVYSVFHQDHDWGEFKNGISDREKAPESLRNKSLLFHPWAACTLHDCNYELFHSKHIVFRYKSRFIERWIRIERIWQIYPDFAWITVPLARLFIYSRKYFTAICSLIQAKGTL